MKSKFFVFNKFLLILFILSVFNISSVHSKRDLKKSFISQKQFVDLAKKWSLHQSGIGFINLKNNQELSLNGQHSYNPASTIKVILMIEIFRLAQVNKLDLKRWLIIQQKNVTETFDFSPYDRPTLKAGERATIIQLLNLMISKSDNIATNTLLDLVNREEMNGYLKELGLKKTFFYHKLTGGYMEVKDPAYHDKFNRATAMDMAILLKKLAKYQLNSRLATKQMLAILGRQFDRTKIGARLPTGVRIYNKTGVNSKGTSDISIIKSKKLHYVLTIYTSLNDKKANKRMAGFSRDLYNMLKQQLKNR